MELSQLQGEQGCAQERVKKSFFCVTIGGTFFLSLILCTRRGKNEAKNVLSEVLEEMLEEEKHEICSCRKKKGDIYLGLIKIEHGEAVLALSAFSTIIIPLATMEQELIELDAWCVDTGRHFHKGL